MRKKLIWSIGIIALAALLVTTVGVTVVLAQDEKPNMPETPCASDHPHRGPGKPGMRSMSDSALAAAAEVLNTTTDELSAALQACTTIATLAEQAGVEEQDVWESIQAAREAGLRAEIAQAVEDGTMTQEKADWLLEGLDKGFLTDGFGFGFGHHDRFGCNLPPTTPETTDE